MNGIVIAVLAKELLTDRRYQEKVLKISKINLDFGFLHKFYAHTKYAFKKSNNSAWKTRIMT